MILFKFYHVELPPPNSTWAGQMQHGQKIKNAQNGLKWSWLNFTMLSCPPPPVTQHGLAKVNMDKKEQKMLKMAWKRSWLNFTMDVELHPPPWWLNMSTYTHTDWWGLQQVHILLRTTCLKISFIKFFCAFWDTTYFVQWSPKFSNPKNLKSPEKPKNANLTNFLLAHYPWPIQIQKESKHANLKFIWNCYTQLQEDAAYRWFVLVALVRSLKNWAPYNSATSSNHPKS